ncbi:DNA methyltransferase [filamentous cyanobacterium CCP5]|nr:DNA methyltransferase [filamentous cyanobacterium CCP5]
MQQSASIASTPPSGNGVANKLRETDQAFHSWYRFVLSFPPHLVQDYIQRFDLGVGATLLDPFCGTGTTVLEAKLQNLNGVGIEANPMAYLASSVKTAWSVDAKGLVDHAEAIATRLTKQPEFQNPTTLRTLPEDTHKLLLKNSIDPLPLHKALWLAEEIATQPSPYQRHQQVAFAKAIVAQCSNLHFGPEVGVRRKKRPDAPVLQRWLQAVTQMAADIASAPATAGTATVHHADARDVQQLLTPQSLDGVFTSPPYPNEKDYTRTTRLETVLLGFIHNRKDLRALKQGLLRSNTRNVYKADTDDQWVADNARVQAIAQEIETRRIELGKTSGFEKLYGRATKLYFGGMARHFASLRPFLKPGAMLGYVVGDQASYLQVMIRTGELLGEIAESLGYTVVSLDLFRTRIATTTQQQIREEVLVLRW